MIRFTPDPFVRVGGYNDELDVVTTANLEISARLKNCLEHEGLFTLRQITERTRAEIARIPNLGHVSLAELESVLTMYQCRLADR